MFSTNKKPANTKMAHRLGRSAATLLLSAGVAFLSGSIQAAPLPSISVRPASGMATISGHVPELIRTSAPLGLLPSDQTLLCSITLPTRNPAGLADLLRGLNDPHDSRYGQYLTPAQFGAQFGPSQAQYNMLVSYLQSKGLTVTQTFPSRTYLSVSGTAGQLNSAFGIALKQFRAPDGRVFHAPDTEVKVPFFIAGLISAVTGLDDANVPTPMLHQIRRRALSKIKALVPLADDGSLVQTPPEQGTGPQGGFAPADFRTVYGLNGTALDGTGQTIAIIEYGTNVNPKDALRYEIQFKLGRQSILFIPVDGGTATYATSGPAETDLDIASQLSMAPKASLRVYLQGRSGSLIDAMAAVANDNIAKQLSISYGFGPEPTTAPISNNELAINAAYTQLAAQGISVYVSSGDSGSQADTDGRTSVDISSSAPMVCSVGGTALLVQKPGVDENYLAESTWNVNNTPGGGATGGGVSQQWPVPSYQVNAANFASAVAGSNVSVTNRNLPDISADASPYTGIAIYVSQDPGLPSAGFYVFGGTSESAPLWAGFTALVNQNRALAGLAPLGFPNNSLYPLAYTSIGLTKSYSSIFHDISDLSSNLTVSGGTNFAAVTGFDDSTGLGTMTGAPLIAALSGGVLAK